MLNSQYLLILEHNNLGIMTTNAEGVGNIVAQHYDNLPEKGREQRKDSRIFFMRCFNNWIKSTLIQEYIEKIRDRNPDGHRIKVLDFGKRILTNIFEILCLDYCSVRKGRGLAQVAEE